ncbi:YkgJ family cysteine cluster protein [Mongoliitalea daihaiensis]|uniref:YkgJ family cysteine cluster protein n=1 Tax=Mongoliitalea daihaiensis TaxID=2782006 RepID=UPI001F268B66|nr:YkgJ family cysteine cluster protein [Mongoliitalea daihaiensis]UJP63887.1 YkgJ family cysteine cluster protein [Mongoliitalea daihaiensis]
MSEFLEDFKQLSKSLIAQHKKMLPKLKRIKSKDLDQHFSQAHEEKFKKMDCLTCANCCKTTSPIFIQTDIDRLAKVFRMKPSEFTEEYLFRDGEGDFVLKSSPCPFLNEDNTCLVYDERPKACREYPHTNRKNMHGILNLTLQNTLVCPVVLEIFQDFDKDFRK